MTVERVPEDLDALVDGEIPRPREVAPLALLQEAVAEDLRLIRRVGAGSSLGLAATTAR